MQGRNEALAERVAELEREVSENCNISEYTNLMKEENKALVEKLEAGKKEIEDLKKVKIDHLDSEVKSEVKNVISYDHSKEEFEFKCQEVRKCLILLECNRISVCL